MSTGNIASSRRAHSADAAIPAKPMAVARVFVARRHTEDGELTLRYWRGAWWGWRRSHWREMEPREVRSALYTFTEHGTLSRTTKARSSHGHRTAIRSATCWKPSGQFVSWRMIRTSPPGWIAARPGR